MPAALAARMKGNKSKDLRKVNVGDEVSCGGDPPCCTFEGAKLTEKRDILWEICFKVDSGTYAYLSTVAFREFFDD